MENGKIFGESGPTRLKFPATSLRGIRVEQVALSFCCSLKLKRVFLKVIEYIAIEDVTCPNEQRNADMMISTHLKMYKISNPKTQFPRFTFHSHQKLRIQTRIVSVTLCLLLHSFTCHLSL